MAQERWTNPAAPLGQQGGVGKCDCQPAEEARAANLATVFAAFADLVLSEPWAPLLVTTQWLLAANRTQNLIPPAGATPHPEDFDAIWESLAQAPQPLLERGVRQANVQNRIAIRTAMGGRPVLRPLAHWNRMTLTPRLGLFEH